VRPDDDPLSTASAVRRGVTSLGRRLRMERPDPGEPLLQLSVLSHLNRRGPMTPGELAAAERVQPQSLTRTLASLEAAGRILRQPDPDDGRRSLLAIAEAGRLALAGDMRQRDAWLAEAMAAHQQARLSAFLTDGHEYKLILVCAVAAIILIGPGRYGLDAGRGWARRPFIGSFVALLVGVGAGIAAWVLLNGANPLA